MARYKTKIPPKKSSNSFPIWLVMAGIGMILVVVWAMLSSRVTPDPAIEVTGAPAIRVDQDVFDYGEVKLGVAPIRTEVRVTNMGDQTLRFTEAPYIEVLEGC